MLTKVKQWAISHLCQIIFIVHWHMYMQTVKAHLLSYNIYRETNKALIGKNKKNMDVS